MGEAAGGRGGVGAGRQVARLGLEEVAGAGGRVGFWRLRGAMAEEVEVSVIDEADFARILKTGWLSSD